MDHFRGFSVFDIFLGKLGNSPPCKVWRYKLHRYNLLSKSSWLWTILSKKVLQYFSVFILTHLSTSIDHIFFLLTTQTPNISFSYSCIDFSIFMTDLISRLAARAIQCILTFISKIAVEKISFHVLLIWDVSLCNVIKSVNLFAFMSLDNVFNIISHFLLYIKFRNKNEATNIICMSSASFMSSRIWIKKLSRWNFWKKSNAWKFFLSLFVTGTIINYQETALIVSFLKFYCFSVCFGILLGKWILNLIFKTGWISSS